MKHKALIFTSILLLFFLLVVPVSAATEAKLIWTKSLGSAVNTVDTNELGTFVWAGLANGKVYCYDYGGALQWSTTLNASNSITKLLVLDTGTYIGAMDSGGWVYILSGSSGAIMAARRDAPVIQDIGISRSNDFFLTAMYQSSFYTYNVTGNITGSNTTAGVSTVLQNGGNFLNLSFDPTTKWIVTSSAANATLVKWIISALDGQKGWNSPEYATPQPVDRLLNNWLWNRTITSTNTFPLSHRSTIRVYTDAAEYGVLGNTTSNIYTPYRDIDGIGYPGWRDFRLTYENKSAVDANYTYFGPHPTNTTVMHSNLSGVPTYLPASSRGTYALGKYWSVGASAAPWNNQVWSSDDGNVWTVRNWSVFPTGMFEIPFGYSTLTNKFYVVGGYDGGAASQQVLSSPDGTVWTIVNETGIIPASRDGGFIGNFNNSMWRLGGSSQMVWNSTDGIRWTLVCGATPFQYYHSYWTVNNTMFAGFYSGSNVWMSKNLGKDWTLVNGTVAATFLDGANTPVIVKGNVVYALGQDGSVWTSDEIGRIWTRVAGPSTWYQVDSYPGSAVNTDNGDLVTWGNDAHHHGILTTGSENYIDITWRVDPYNSPYKYVLYYGNRSVTTHTTNTSIVPEWVFTGTINGQQTNHTLIYPRNQTDYPLTGFVTVQDVAEMGGWIGVSTATNLANVEVTDAGFGTVNTVASAAGASRDVSCADYSSFVAETRNLRTDIYDVTAVLKGTYTSGGNVNSVDFAAKNGLWVTSGGRDGKMMIFSKDATAAWYAYYAGDSDAEILSTSVSWRGEYAGDGRIDGTLDYYSVQVVSTGITYDNVLVLKDGYPLMGVEVTIANSPVYPYVWTDVGTGVTDEFGKFSFAGNIGEYYRITIPTVHQQVFQVIYGQTEYIIQVPYTPPVQTKMDYWTAYDLSTHRITYYYNDTQGQTTAVKFTAIRTVDNSVWNVTDFSLPGDTFRYNQTASTWDGNSSYYVTMEATRGGIVYKNTWLQIGKANTTQGLPGYLDPRVRQTMMLVMILFAGGLFSYMGGPEGAIIVVIFAMGLVYFKWMTMDWGTLVFCLVWAFLGFFGRKSAESG